MLFKKPRFGKYGKGIGKGKLVSTIEEAALKKAYIPSPVKYHHEIDWSKNFPSANNGKFFKETRCMMGEEIA